MEINNGYAQFCCCKQYTGLKPRCKIVIAIPMSFTNREMQSLLQTMQSPETLGARHQWVTYRNKSNIYCVVVSVEKSNHLTTKNQSH